MIFKSRNADALEDRLNSFLEKFEKTTSISLRNEKRNDNENRVTAGIALAGAAGVYTLAGVVVAGSLPMVCAGAAVAVGALAYSGISNLFKEHYRKKTAQEMNNKGEHMIDMFASEIQVSRADLRNLTSKMKNKEDISQDIDAIKNKSRSQNKL